MGRHYKFSIPLSSEHVRGDRAPSCFISLSLHCVLAASILLIPFCKWYSKNKCCIIFNEEQKQNLVQPCQFLFARLSFVRVTSFRRYHFFLIFSATLSFHIRLLLETTPSCIIAKYMEQTKPCAVYMYLVFHMLRAL